MQHIGYVKRFNLLLSRGIIYEIIIFKKNTTKFY